MQAKIDPRGSVTYAGSISSGAIAGSAFGTFGIPQPTPQVEAQLDSAMFSMEALENTVAALISRLEPVTGCYAEEAVGANAASMLVPVAARISHIEERVRNCEARLSRALGALQI